MILMVLEIEVGIKNRSKIDLNLGSPLGIDFSWIWMDFGRFLEAKLASSWLQNRSQEASKKGCQKVGILDRIFGRLGGFQEGPEGGGAPSREKDFRPPKEGRFCGEGGICGEVRKVGGRTPDGESLGTPYARGAVADPKINEVKKD